MRAREAESSLKKLSRQLATHSSRHDDLVDSHSAADHASNIARLDTLKFRTAKAAADAETEAERLALAAADLQARLHELELQGIEGDQAAAARRRDPVDDEVLLRLKVYRSLGIDLERDERDGDWSKAVARNDRKGDVRVINLDKRFSRYFIANVFWNAV